VSWENIMPEKERKAKCNRVQRLYTRSPQAAASIGLHPLAPLA
jgi:hypothetical protein